MCLRRSCLSFFSRNTILVDGEGQIKGSGGSLLSQGVSGEWKWISVEADSGYEALSAFRRVLVFSVKQKCFFVLDHGQFKYKGAHQVSWHWHGEGSALAKENSFRIPGRDLSIAGTWAGENDGVRLSLGDGFVDAPEKPKVKYAILQKEFQENTFWFATRFFWGAKSEIHQAKPLAPAVRFGSKGLELAEKGLSLNWDGKAAPKISGNKKK